MVYHSAKHCTPIRYITKYWARSLLNSYDAFFFCFFCFDLDLNVNVNYKLKRTFKQTFDFFVLLILWHNDMHQISKKSHVRFRLAFIWINIWTEGIEKLGISNGMFQFMCIIHTHCYTTRANTFYMKAETNVISFMQQDIKVFRSFCSF